MPRAWNGGFRAFTGAELLLVENGDAFDEVELGELALEIGVALELRFDGIGTGAAAVGGVAVAGVEVEGDVHSFCDSSEGDEVVAVEVGIVFEVDEDLGTARIGGCFGEGERAFDVLKFAGRVVGDGEFAPVGVELGVASDAELGDGSAKDAVEAGFVEETGGGEFEETVGSAGGPFAVDFDGDVAFGGFELGGVAGWRRRLRFGGFGFGGRGRGV